VEPTPESAPDSSPLDPQAIFAGLSITDMEADVEALLDERMSKLDDMLDGLDRLVARIEGEVAQLETTTSSDATEPPPATEPATEPSTEPRSAAPAEPDAAAPEPSAKPAAAEPSDPTADPADPVDPPK